MHRLSVLLRLTSLLLLVAGPALAQAPRVPTATRPPAPEDVLGFRIGAEGQLAPWADIVGYFQRLDAASPRVRVEEIGSTVLGKPMILATITSEANQRRLEEIRSNQARLADPRGLSEAEIARLVAEQPAVLFIGASLHGNEIMATQMSMELAHELATDPALGAALRDVVVLLVPGMNPDGLDLVREWYLRTRATPHWRSPMPWLYHHYTGHDNNRDFFMVTQPETEAVTRVLYERWFPEVVWDVHQMGNRGARYFIPPYDDPLNPNVHPLIVRMTNVVGTQIALDLAEAGKTGVEHGTTFDLWWHGGGRTVPARHNMVGILSEAASANTASALYQWPDSLRQPRTGSMFAEAWEGGWWRPRDIVEYELITGRSLVNLLQRQREDFVRNFVNLAREQVRLGREGGPFAYVVPVDQRDPGSAAEMLRVLRKGGVEVHEAREPFTAAGRAHPAGTRVVLMAQPFRAHAKDLLEPQEYPDIRQYPGGPPDVPYDVAGWTLPIQMGVEAVEVEEPFETGALVRLDSVPVRSGTVRGTGTWVALDPRMNNTHRAIHEVLADEGRVVLSTAPIEVSGERWPVGTPLVTAPGLGHRVERWAREWGVDAAGHGEPVGGRTLERLRVGLYKPWTASMDEGWTRWLFEEWKVPFDTLHDADIRGGALRARFDAIVIPDLSYRQMMRGLSPEVAPAEYAGGLGDEGARALEEFVRAGGTLLLLDSSTEFAIRELGVPVRDATDGQEGTPAERWYAPGSLLRVHWDASHPVAYGMPEESAVYYAHSPVFEVDPGARGVRVVARYPEADLLLSGYSQNEARVTGKAALVEADVGEGRVVLFGFRPQHRGQPHETFKVLFNALYVR